MANVPNIFISPLSRRGKKCLKRKERRRGVSDKKNFLGTTLEPI